jgi:hypothetical protein
VISAGNRKPLYDGAPVPTSPAPLDPNDPPIIPVAGPPPKLTMPVVAKYLCAVASPRVEHPGRVNVGTGTHESSVRLAGAPPCQLAASGSDTAIDSRRHYNADQPLLVAASGGCQPYHQCFHIRRYLTRVMTHQHGPPDLAPRQRNGARIGIHAPWSVLYLHSALSLPRRISI